MFIHLEVLRGLAVAAVVAFHWGFLAWGWVGVDVFFLITGYLVGGKILQSVFVSNFSFSQFIMKRFRRLAPALGFTICLVSIFSIFFVPNSTSLGQIVPTAIGSIFGAGNIAVHIVSGDYFGLDASKNPLTHLWSLGAEWQIYLYFGLLGWIFSKLRLPGAAIILLVVGAVGSAVALLLFSTQMFDSSLTRFVFGYYSPVPRFWEFALGVWAAQTRYQPSRAIRVSATLASLLCLPQIGDDWGESSIWLILLVLTLAISVAHSSTSKPTLLSLPITHLGSRAYSIYLLHWPIWVIFGPDLLTVTILTIILSEISFRIFEPRVSKASK